MAATEDSSTAVVTGARLHECRDCGQMQVVPPMPPATRAVCLRCDSVLRHTRHHPMLLPLALNLSALVLILLVLLGGTLTIISVSTAGQLRAAALLSGPIVLNRFGLWELALVVLVTTLAAPLARVLAMLTVFLGARCSARPPNFLRSTSGPSVSAHGRWWRSICWLCSLPMSVSAT